MSIFLRMKHWQLFCLLLVLPFVSIVTFILYVSTLLMSGREEALQIEVFIPIVVLMFANYLCYYAWLWTLGSFSISRLPDTIKKSRTLFTAAIIYPLCYIPTFFWIMFSSVVNSSKDVFQHYFLIIFAFHILAIFCNFYIFYFIAKMFKQAELQRRATVSEYLGEIFLLWFFYIGIWILQPRVNKLYEESQNA